MTTESAAARPYSVTFDALHLHQTLILGTDTVRAIDNGLTQDEKDELTRPDKRTAIVWINKLASVFVFILGLALMAVSAVYFFDHAGYPVLAGGFILGGAVTTGFFWAHIHGGQIRRQVMASSERLIESGRLAYWHQVEPDIRSGLTRVAKALNYLQERSGTEHDSKAREAVAAVIRQYANEPTKRQVAIAESTATDPVSTTIRAKTLAAQDRWRADVATAELLVQELEEASKVKS